MGGATETIGATSGEANHCLALSNPMAEAA